MADDTALRRLQVLQRDLVAFTESRLSNIARLASQLDACVEDFKKLLERKKKNNESRTKLASISDPQPATITIDEVEYSIQTPFRESALRVADELDLDEVEAAKLCIESQLPSDNAGDSLTLRALLRFHQQRQALLDCLRMLLQLSLDSDGDENNAEAFGAVAIVLIQGEGGNQADSSAYWRKCIDGLADVESFLKKVGEYKDKIIMTGQDLSGEVGEAVAGQRYLLTRQHESLAAVLSYLLRGNYVQPEDYRGFLSKAAALETEVDIAVHYLPILTSGAACFASDHSTTMDAARSLHSLFAAGPGQLQWKNAGFKGAATVFWLAEYNARFSAGASDNTQSEAERSSEEEARSKLFFDCLKDKAFHFLLAAASFLRPVVWHDPARKGIIEWLVDDAVVLPADAPRSSDEFALLVMRELQIFTDAFVTNMPDTLRRLKSEEDEQRRNQLFQSANGDFRSEMGLERFMIIMAYAYQDDVDAVRDFWSDRESNLYGFLRWVSQRLPTPRVAAFCTLLKAIACDDKSANQAHRFLLEDVAMPSGKLRRAHAVSWTQIFNEIELYASSVKDRPAVPQSLPNNDFNGMDEDFQEPETYIMLESYLGLAAHISRTSPEARTWLLKDQSFHIGETMYQLARTGTVARVKACCLDVLSALLTDHVAEVRNGMWVLLDNWISSNGQDSTGNPRMASRAQQPDKQYLQHYANNAEASSALIGLLNALVAPLTTASDVAIDALPFPENLGAPHRHPGIETYVDFVMDGVFARGTARMISEGDVSMLDAVRHDCLQFALKCLSMFNEDLVLLANTADVSVEAAMETKSLAVYARLHPFARVMEWLFEKGVAASLFSTLQRSTDVLEAADPNSPLVQSTLRSVQVLNLAWKLQSTYFDIVRPIITSQASRSHPETGATAASIDELFLSHLDAVSSVAEFTSCIHVEIGLECLTLLQKIASSRKLSEGADVGSTRARHTSRIIGVLTPLTTSLNAQLRQDFILDEWDLETGDIPLKLIKAKAVLDLLNASLDASNGKPSVAHCLLGFSCFERVVDALPNSSFAEGTSLFHEIAARAATLETIGPSGNTAFLLAVKRGCLDVVLKLAVSPLTVHIVQPVLRSMEFLAALSRHQTPASPGMYWDGLVVQDQNLLFGTSALALRDFLHVRQAFFQFAAVSLRTASEQTAFSVQEKILGTLLGSVNLPDGEQIPTLSIFELFDFFDLETSIALEPNCKYLASVDLSGCTKDDPETLIAYDLKMAEDLLILHKKELKDKGGIREPAELELVDVEIQAILASLVSQNNWRAVQNARLNALEAWTDLMSLMVTKGGLGQSDVVALSLQGLLVVLPKFEKCLTDNLVAASLLAKLTLTFTNAIGPASQDPSAQTVNVAIERLLSSFRVSLKVVTDSSTDLALRDVCYRTCCTVLSALPKTSPSARTTSSASAKQLLQLVQNAGERLVTIATEDAFSGRGVTRVSAVLFLDGLIALFHGQKASRTMLRALTKLNFVPVLIDTSIGSVAAAFAGGDEMVTTLAYFHTALALLLRLCQTPDGTQLVLNSGLFQAIDDSSLFSTDPDIGLDIDNASALKEFYAILADVLRLITAAVLSKGAEPAKVFLQRNRYTVQAIFKQASRGQATEVADELQRLLLATDFLEDDEAAAARVLKNGFS